MRRARPVPAWLLPGLVLLVWFGSWFTHQGLPSEGRTTCHDLSFFLASGSEKGCLAPTEGPWRVRAQAILVG